MCKILPSLLVVALALVGCGGDSSGPSSASFAGTYPGQFYIISNSTSPVERDSTNGGAVTLSLASTGGENYTLSTTTTIGGSSAPVTVNSAGAMSFPNFDEAEALDLVGSLATGICTVTGANATPSGSVVSQRLTFTLLVSGGFCDWSGDGTDIRPTLIQLTWTGTKT